MIRKIGFSLLAFGLLFIAGQTSSYAAGASAAPTVKAPGFPVTVNGSVVDNKHSLYPLLLYRDITYFPMTWNYTRALGMTTAWDPVNGLAIGKQESCEPVVRQDLTSQENSDKGMKATLVPFPVSVNGKSITNAEEQYPLLLFRNIVYFPMTWNNTHDVFGWTTSWDATNGFGVQACEKAPGADAQQAVELNIANGGQLAVQGGWIYMNPANKYYGPNSLVKMKLDGSGKQTLSEDNALSINVVDDWIYYTVRDKAADKNLGIFKMKTDGSQRTQISSAGAYSVWVRDGWIYYIAGNGMMINGIHKMKTDGSEDTAIVSGQVGGRFYLDGDLMYFMMPDKEHAPNSLFQIKTDGTGKKKLQDEVNAVAVIDGWVYYSTVSSAKKGIYKMSADGTVNIPLYSSDQPLNGFQYRDGWIYFIRGSFGIMGSASIEKMRVDGTGHTALGNVRATSLYFAGADLYYPSAFDGDNELRKLELGK
ncbi:DUF5050 domain-containing protein [Paenibacillus elgii]|uniref:DUF5050 domain-containing protein n=1 Tax=Paenibacillus elgii TaxID=189691 RepID=UPI0020406AAD|nr:DUF5050 domain-containing protein [Paenibacillus elgii]MCM3267596.1 DUF5050 domain-containing protein [Paenibacillus elgii]